jgi:hypothetical protein
VIGSISFQSLSTQSSGYVPLPIINLAAYKPNALAYSDAVPTAGQVAVINNLAILQAAETTAPSRTITVLGKIGATYQVQYCTNFGAGTVWYPLTTYSQTNTTQNLNVDPTLSPVLYRVQQK